MSHFFVPSDIIRLFSDPNLNLSSGMPDNNYRKDAENHYLGAISYKNCSIGVDEWGR